ncbi:MAG: DPP IV N-terminal domain-containing protein [Fimbriimonas sp.]|nr:DPP IV N-terminal domain-containing protein [Fimbriimonas sp.]
MRLLAIILVLGVSGAISAQDQPQANWKLMNQFGGNYLRQYVYSTSLTPNFINKTDEFWYSWKDSKGVKFWRVNPKAKKKEPLFDSAKMAAYLSEYTKKPYDTTNLPLTTLTFDEKNDRLIKFTVDNLLFSYDTEKDEFKKLEKPKETPPAPTPPEDPAYIGRTGGGGGFGGFGGGGRGAGGAGAARDFRNWSPDKSAFIYAQEHNLFYVAVVDKKEQPPVQLSKDGVKDYSFGSRSGEAEIQQMMQQDGTTTTQGGTANANEQRVRAGGTWSKDSKRFYTSRTDQRKVKDLYLVNSLTMPRPSLMTYKYSMPGEAEVAQQESWVFEPETKTISKMEIGKWKDQRAMDMHFQDASSDVIRFVRRDRLQRNMEVCDYDVKTKKTSVLVSESVENAFLESQQIRYLKPGGDFIWWSERTGWGHFYLYSNDGKLKNAITSGPYRASTLVDVEPEKGRMWFSSNGREEDENPYYKHLYRVNLDGKDLTLLDKGDADHSSTLTTSKNFAVDLHSRTDMAPVAVLRDNEGKTILELEKTDLSRLMQTGWKMPQTFQVKAADGVTDIYGNMWLPFDFDKTKKYPIIANVYPGPQTESVTTAFSATAGNQRLAQLGFIVIQIGNRGGNPARSNAYHSYGYYNLRDYGLSDKKAGIEQLAAQNPWIDIDRVGIYGHSGGGFMTAAALMLPPYNDFFKVGVSSAGNHDNNVYNQNWSEQHHGLKEVPVTTTTKAADAKPEDSFLGWDDPQFDSGYGTTGTRFDIKVPTNAELAANLKGHLFLVHGDMDNNVHHAGTVRLMDALIKANKRFDFMSMPGQAHGFGPMQNYFVQRMYEYFVQNLMGAPLPKGVDMVIAP